LAAMVGNPGENCAIHQETWDLLASSTCRNFATKLSGRMASE